MFRYFLKKIRTVRALFALLMAAVIILFFQNCAPQCGENNKDSAACKKESSSSQPSTTPTPTTSGSSVWGARPGGSGVTVGGGSSGSSTSGGGSSSGGGGVIIGGGGSGGGGSTGGDGSSTNTTFRITKQPAGVTVTEKQQFTLEVVVAGGTYPYAYQWYKDNAPITNGLGDYNSYSDVASSYSKEGVYHVIVRDAKGQSLQSSTARVTVQEEAGPCEAGSYFTYTSTSVDQAYSYISNYFESTRGKYLLHKSFDTANILYQNRSYTTLSDYNVPSTLPYMGKTFINCRTAIPRIHNPTQNPAYSFESGIGPYDDGGNYKYDGSISLECRNKKLKLVANTCNWVYSPPPPDWGGGGG